MLYSELCPLWVISSLDDDSANEFAKKLEKQLMAFSKNEFGSEFNSDHDRWWRIDNIHNPANIPIDQSGHPADIPVYSKKAADNVDLSCLTIVFFGDNSRFDTCISAVEELKKREEKNEFMRGVGNQVRFYGLLSFQKGEKINGTFQELVKLLEKEDKEKKKNTKKSKKNSIKFFPFDSVFLQGDCNRVFQNQYCYDKLVGDDGKRNDLDLSVQVIYHLALTHDVLSLVNQQRLVVVGAFSLNYEPKKERDSYAVDLTNTIVKKFSTDNQGEHWCKDNQADISEQFKLEQGWKAIYVRLKIGFRNLETTDLVPQSSVSPWKLFLKILIPYYFKKYIRGLVRHLKDNVDGFSFVTHQNYKNHIDNQFEGMVRDEEQRKHIEDELTEILNKDNLNNNTIGIQQFLSRLKKMIGFYEEQKGVISGLLDKKTADGKNNGFPELADYPLGKFGIYQRTYSKYVKLEKDAGKEDIYGEGLLNKTINVLSFHPVPLGLLVRSVLLGILLPIVILTSLKLIPDNLFNTAYLESQPGSTIFCVGCLLICVGWALLKYGLGVIGRIKDNISNFVGWCLYQLQMTAYRMTLEKENEYYDRCITICEEIKTRGEAFVKLDTVLKKDNNVGFEENMFQANVMGKIEENVILKKGIVIPKIKTVINRYGEQIEQTESIIPEREDKKDELHYGILQKALIVDDDNGVKDQLKKILFGHKSDTDFERIKFDLEQEKQLMCKKLCEVISKGIVFYINDRQIGTISDIVFDANGNCNFYNWERSTDDPQTVISNPIGTIIYMRSFPSADVLDSFLFASIVVPDRFNEWRTNLSIENEHEDRYNTSKGSYEASILQGISVSNISLINDIKLD